MDSFAAEKALKELPGNASAAVSSIGPAGENLCSYACINSDLYRQAARGGVGTVMGSKRLKAIVAKGSGKVEYHDHQKVVELNRANYERAKVSQVFQARSKYGTPLTLNFTHTGGILPTKNFQYGTWDKALGKIDSVGVYKSVKAHRSCQSCFVHCSLITEVAEGKYKGTTLEGPEYETLGMFGSNLLIDSLPTVIQANVLCDKLGLDTISAGNVIGFAMECFEKGLLTAGQTGRPGAELRGRRGLPGRHRDDRRATGVRGYPGAGGPGRGRPYRRQAPIASPCRSRGWNSPPTTREAPSVPVSPMPFLRGAPATAGPGRRPRRSSGAIPPTPSKGKGKMIRDLYAENCIFHSLLVCDMPAKFIPLSLDDYARLLSRR